MPKRQTRAPYVKQFTSQELEWLVSGLQQYGTNYVEILSAFPFANRTRTDLRILYKRLSRFCKAHAIEPTDTKVLDLFPLSGRRTWTDQQTEALCEAVKKHGTHWLLISKLYQTGPLSSFTPTQLDCKWRKLFHSLKEEPENEGRQFRMLDVLDEFGNPYFFRASSADTCAQQAKKLKYELMRLEDLTTGHVRNT